MNGRDLNFQLNRLLHYALQRDLIRPEDEVWAANRLLALLGGESYEKQPVEETLPWPAEPLSALCDWAAEQGKIDGENIDERDRFDTELMACLTPRPSEVAGEFYRLAATDKKAASDYYYGLSVASNYIRADRVARDRKWTSPTPYGDLIITINLSKPEKDPKAIAAARSAPQAGYPKCALCRENEGYLGGGNQAPRGSHRLIPLTLDGERWFLQYSPYVYYNEHCIVLCGEHRPMRVSRETFRRLLEFVDLLPHYFIGSNADLPIVGGSILSHDHFQGGNFEFPMAKAPLREEISLSRFPQISAGIVRWPMSVLRLRGGDAEALIEAANRILEKWRGYSDESAEIFARTDADHNTITPIARRRGGDYEIDLVLRNNRTTEEHPLGLFHPHGEYHHIKKENIGLIEVMGLAILPPRLLEESRLTARALSHPEETEEIFRRPEMAQHRSWYESLAAAGAPLSEAEAETAVQNSIGEIFAKILGDAGVFKDTEAGRAAFRRFCAGL